MKQHFSADLYGLFVWLFAGLVLHVAFPYAQVPILNGLSLAWRLFIELNIATFVLYGFDKMSAQVQTRRIPERMLYLATFAGGSIGALLAINLFRHKTRKPGFLLVIALLILVQIALLLYV